MIETNVVVDLLTNSGESNEIVVLSSQDSDDSIVVVDESSQRKSNTRRTLKRPIIYELDCTDDVVMLPLTNSVEKINENDFTIIDSESSSTTDYNDLVILTSEFPVKRRYRKPALAKILDIFPDADSNFVKAELEKFKQDVDEVIRYMVENGYDKYLPPVETPELDYLNNDAWETDEQYRRESLALLNSDFPFVLMHAISNMFKQNNYHYSNTRLEFEKILGVKVKSLLLEKNCDNNNIKDILSDSYCYNESPVYVYKQESWPVGSSFKNKPELTSEVMALHLIKMTGYRNW